MRGKSRGGLGVALLLAVTLGLSCKLRNGPTPILAPVEPPWPPRHGPRVPTPMPAPKPAPTPAPRPTPRPTPAPIVHKPSPWLVGIGGMMDWPVAGWNPSYNLGSGGRVEVGLALDKTWVIGAGLDYAGFSGSFFNTPVSDQDLRWYLLVRYLFGRGPVRPYLTGRAGQVWQDAKAQGTEYQGLSPMGAVGAGVEMGLGGRVALYGELLNDFIFAPGVMGWDIPFTVGLRVGL